jgi:hypothetical protein
VIGTKLVTLFILVVELFPVLLDPGMNLEPEPIVFVAFVLFD